MTHWGNDAGSMLVLGRTQTGKTTAAKEIHAENSRISIWVNERGSEMIRGVSGSRYKSLEGIKRGLARNERKFNLLSGNPESDIQELTSFIWEAAERTDRGLPWQIVIDEFHRYAPQTQKQDLEPRDSIRRIAKEGQKRNIRFIGITQDPVSVDKQTIRQREYLLVYPLTSEQSTYMRDYGVDPEVVNSQPEFHGVLYHATGDVIQEGIRAKRKYA